MRAFNVLFAAALLPASALAGEPPRLSLPLTCEPHKTCFIQSYVDLDAGPGVRDYACGSATYDGHRGVDFRVLSIAAAQAGVPVIASADGTVKGVRDGVADVLMTDASRQALKGQECGNGVVVDHGDGWETQYCHLKQASVRVAKGDVVRRGQQLGDVGYSGAAEFAHVHLSVRHNGKVVDPYLPSATDGACQQDAKAAGLWDQEAAAAFPYANGELIALGFGGAPPDHKAFEVDHQAVTPLAATSPALLLYARFVNLREGDVIRIVATGPSGALADTQTAPLDRNKATYVSFAGKKRTAERWPSGRYDGKIELVRAGAVIASRNVSTDLP